MVCVSTVVQWPTAAYLRIWGNVLVAAAMLGLVLLAGWGMSAIRQKPSAPAYSRITFRRGKVYGARFASDGQTVVYSAAWEGQPARIFATRAGSIESRSLQLPDARVLAISANGELAISIGRETIWDSAGTLARAPLEGGAPRELLENVSLADWSPDGRDLAVVHKIEGKYRVEFPIGKVLYETTEGITSMRFSPRGDRLAIVPWSGAILSIDLAGKATTITKGWINIGNVAWRPDGSEIWFSGERPAGKFALYAVTPSGRELTVRVEAAGLLLFDISKDGRVLLNDYFWDSNPAARPAGETAARWHGQPSVQWPPFHERSQGRSEQTDETALAVSPRRKRNAPMAPAVTRVAWPSAKSARAPTSTHRPLVGLINRAAGGT